MLGCFLFAGDDVFKKIKVLSGGEKARVSLAKTLVSEANFLLLDEPTNHLDIDSIEIIIEALKRYEGTLIFVSHNRYFIEKLANKVWWIEDEDVREYPGTYHEYLYKQSQEEHKSKPIKQKKKLQTVEAEPSKNSWKLRDESEEQLKKLKKKLAQKEEQTANAKSHTQKIEAKLSDTESLSSEDIAALGKEYSEATERLKGLESECDDILEDIILLED